MRICCNIECAWKGDESKCVHQPHSPEDKLCPECHEVTEEVEREVKMEEKVKKLKERYGNIKSPLPYQRDFQYLLSFIEEKEKEIEKLRNLFVESKMSRDLEEEQEAGGAESD